MAKEKLEKNEYGAYPCKTCLRKHIISYPTISKVMGLYYAKCSNCECDKYDPYEFIGTTEKSSIENWNQTMVHDYDSSSNRDYSDKGANNETKD